MCSSACFLQILSFVVSGSLLRSEFYNIWRTDEIQVTVLTDGRYYLQQNEAKIKMTFQISGKNQIFESKN